MYRNIRTPALAATLICITTLMLSACSGSFNKQDSGTVIGALAGGILGNQVGKGSGKVLATVAGAVIGGVVGSEIGKSLDENDRRAAAAAEYRALENGQSGTATPWRNPDSGHHGVIVPTPPYQESGRNCREYTHTIYINDEPQIMKGKACRSNDGTWTKVS